MTFKSIFLAAAATFSLAATANAAPLFSAPTSTGELASPGSFSKNFLAGAGAGLLTFNLEGYVSLDGFDNCCTDTFTLSLNGVAIWQGEYDLGGGGANHTDFAPSGSGITPVSFGSFAGGKVAASIPLNLVGGMNTLTFAYNGSNQGLGDEGWGTNKIVVTGTAVPEPTTWALMLTGFGMVGYAMRKRAHVTVAYS